MAKKKEKIKSTAYPCDNCPNCPHNALERTGVSKTEENGKIIEILITYQCMNCRKIFTIKEEIRNENNS